MNKFDEEIWKLFITSHNNIRISDVREEFFYKMHRR